ncbi:MAG: hypothetical protein VB013_05840 [Anaerolineaceae bacterium]|nr:hypothetical protein [Anaerolineaceae bacterium]
MLLFLPVFLILIFTLLIQVVGRSRIPLGTKWLILTAIAVLLWGATMAMQFKLPLTQTIAHWLPSGQSAETLTFTLDRASWTLSMALLSMLVGIILTDTGRLGSSQSLSEWTQLLMLTFLGLIAVLANSPLAFLLTWTLIDLVEIIVLVGIHPRDELPVQTIAVFGSRFAGTVFVLLAMVLGYQNGSALTLSQAGGTPLTLLVFGAALRLGVVPLHLPYTMDINLRRSLGSALRLIPPLAAFAFIARLPEISSVSGWLFFVLLFAVLGTLFGSIKWFSSKNELEGRPYWLMAFSSLALISLLNGKPEAASYLGLIMAVLGSWAFLQSIELKWLKFLTPIAVLAMIGFPLTSSATLVGALNQGAASATFFLVWIGLAFLSAGLVKFSVVQSSEQKSVETWQRLFYIAGMVFMLLVPWLVEIWYFSEWTGLSGLVSGLATAILIGIILALTYNAKVRAVIIPKLTQRFFDLKKRIGMILERFFRFDWFYLFIGFFVNLVERMLNSINAILEGEGGILWALVFLVLLISLISSVKGG